MKIDNSDGWSKPRGTRIGLEKNDIGELGDLLCERDGTLVAELVWGVQLSV